MRRSSDIAKDASLLLAIYHAPPALRIRRPRNEATDVPPLDLPLLPEQPLGVGEEPAPVPEVREGEAAS